MNPFEKLLNASKKWDQIRQAQQARRWQVERYAQIGTHNFKEGSATDMRFERTALYAAEHGFQTVTTTNATSRWKDAGHGIIYHLPPERCGSWMLDVYFSLAALDLWTLRGVLQTGSIFGIGLGSKF